MDKQKKTKKPAKKSAENKSNSGKNKEFYYILGFMAALIIIFLIIYAMIYNYNNFDYKGLKFIKEKFGEISVYHYYYFFDYGGETYKYNLFLRNDPRKNDIPIEKDSINYNKGEYVYLGVNNNGLNSCEYGSVAVAGLVDFLENNFIRVRAGTNDKEQAEQNNQTYVSCSTTPDRITIIIREGEETQIKKIGHNCHIIEVANCEILEAVEKFEVQSILDAKSADTSGTKIIQRIPLQAS